MYGPGAWTYSEIQAMPAAEFYQHLMLSRRADANEKHWSIAAATFCERPERQRREMVQALDAQFYTGCEWIKPTERVCAQTRALMIGSELTVYGERWARANQDEMRWLQSEGISPEEAMRRHADWLEEERKNPFWSRGRNSTRRRSR